MPTLLSGPAVLTLPSGRPVAVKIRVHPKARHIRLTVAAHFLGIELVLPRPSDLVGALAFARSRATWIERGLDALPPPVSFVDGACFPFLGEAVTIRQLSGPDGFVLRAGNELLVAGAADTRVRAWLEDQALRDVARRVHENARILGVSFDRIAIADTRSRWGCCTPEGVLQFSWRLVMAPVHVLDYVVAHEVAHLRELNHGPRFWRHVRRLVGDIAPAQQWLRDHGGTLHRYGAARDG